MKHRRLNREDPLSGPSAVYGIPVASCPVVVGVCLQDVVFFENTPGYEEQLLEAELGHLAGSSR